MESVTCLGGGSALLDPPPAAEEAGSLNLHWKRRTLKFCFNIVYTNRLFISFDDLLPSVNVRGKEVTKCRGLM